MARRNSGDFGPVHELEFEDADKRNLLQRMDYCSKNPGHIHFIPVTKFTAEHIPQGNPRDAEFIMAVSNLTVRTVTNFKSKQRRSNCECCNLRGRHGINTHGSGMVSSVRRAYDEKDDETCPCLTCLDNPDSAKTQWGQFEVITAAHVVYNSDEAMHTKCNLWFDSDQDLGSCPSLQGVKYAICSEDVEYCRFHCITHDGNVSERLESMVLQFTTLLHAMRLPDSHPLNRSVPRNRDTRLEGLDKLTFIVSHPHGRSKQITVGDWIGIDSKPPRVWTYTADTCSGSSGAPVWIRRYKTYRYQRSAHCGVNESSQNVSGGWHDHYADREPASSLCRRIMAFFSYVFLQIRHATIGLDVD